MSIQYPVSSIQYSSIPVFYTSTASSVCSPDSHSLSLQNSKLSHNSFQMVTNAATGFLQNPLNLNFSFSSSSSSSYSQIAFHPFIVQKSYVRYKPIIKITCISSRPNKRSSSKSVNSEAQELVRLILRNFSDKEPLVSTLNKYVKILRTEHCFMLFEDLGKSDKWLQCLEVRIYGFLFFFFCG